LAPGSSLERRTTHDRILVKREEEKEAKKGGIIIPVWVACGLGGEFSHRWLNVHRASGV
jgi:hypothetical protein